MSNDIVQAYCDAVARHGWTEVLRALSRQERAPKSGISAFGSQS